MKKAFIIDDENMVITLLSEYLVKSNFICQSAQNGFDVISKIKAFQPDIIICDLNIQPVNGITILKEVKEKQELRNIPFIFISALEDEDIILEGLAAGAAGYISKSLDIEEFKIRLMHIIERRLSRLDNKENHAY